MHRSYQPLTPATNRLLKQRWELRRFEGHCCKVRDAKPMVDTKGIETPAHIQHNRKKVQMQKERMSIIERDNHLLASRLAAITLSEGLVDHRNHYSQRSLNTYKRKETLLQMTHENQEIYQRITTQKSDYRRDLWEDDWERVKRCRDSIARYPRGVASKQKPTKVVKFSGGSQRSPSGVEEDIGETTEEEPQPATI